MARARLLIAVVIVLLIGAGVWYWLTRGRESTDDAQIDSHVTQVSARVAGTLVKVAVDDNQTVDAGAMLVELDPRDYQVAVDRARAELADAEAAAQAAQTNVPITSTTASSNILTARGGVAQAQSGIVAAEHEVAAARARLTAAQAKLREAEANATKATRDVERLRGLLAKDEVSQQQFDAAVAAADAQRAAADSSGSQVAEAEAGVPAAQSKLMQARAAEQQAHAELQSAQTAPQQVLATKARASAAEAHVQQARANLAQAELNLQYATVKAPIRGVVSRKGINAGQVVQAGQPLLAIVDVDHVWVTANFKETQLRNMRAGQNATVDVDAYGGREYKGRVDSIAGATGARFSLLPPENATGNFVKVVQRVPVKIALDPGQDPEHLLRPGMSVTPTVFTR
ncbi:MAG: HlyD family secretion protein [Acidobacteria bacterium]|nr:MAG: HlyD family secretion protein [Acidobacteriota bacterium]PYQ92110.1 MAG: HlyD family secretion protein [Acidobacteriota bacterium]PYR08040.1 MAG: HlyD family secretion protein [Acidobacteriota bacterium]